MSSIMELYNSRLLLKVFTPVISGSSDIRLDVFDTNLREIFQLHEYRYDCFLNIKNSLNIGSELIVLLLIMTTFTGKILSMLLSMTGYGKATVVIGKQSLAVQIRSLNSKTLDIFAKLPPFLRDREIEIRSLVGSQLERGKIDISITNDEFGGCGMHSLNFKLADFYREQIREMMFQLSLDPPQDYVSLLLKMPNVVQTATENIEEQEWKNIELAIRQALEELKVWRRNEGRVLEADITDRTLKIMKFLEKVVPLEKARREKIQLKLRNNIDGLGKEISIDENRMEQELIYYLDRIDISEEILRAQQHCSYFLELLRENVTNGKKLLFASQEILRELNTMGVKANDAEIQILTVEMKDETEKIREQLANIL